VKGLIVDEAESETVREIFELAAQASTGPGIAEVLHTRRLLRRNA